MAPETGAWRVERLTDDDFLTYARASAHPIPIEQAPAWDAFDRTVAGRRPWGRFAVWSGGEQPAAVIALTRFAGRGFDYLWAKHGPIWIAEQTAGAELAARGAIAAYLRERDPASAFVRLHARHPAPDLHDLLQTVTYDRTVKADLSGGDDGILAGLNKRTRKKLRAVERDDAMAITDETGISREDFEELYAIHQETAARAEFGIFGADVYYGMLGALGEHARLFVARRTDTPEGARAGRAVAWLISTMYDGGGVNYYSGANAEGRRVNAPLLLRWHAMSTFAGEGVTTYDFMGVDSPRAPSLVGVGEFKRQFGPEVAVDGAWDLPLRPWRYRALTAALRAKKLLRR